MNRKRWILVFLLFILLAPVLDLSAQQQPIRPKMRRGKVPRSLVRGFSVSVGGSGGGVSCFSPDYPDETSLYTDVGFQKSGDVYIGFPDRGMSVTSPAICARVLLPTDDLTVMYALSPAGERLIPVWRGVSGGTDPQTVMSVHLPLEAFSQPGNWRLGVNYQGSFEIKINIAQPVSPFVLEQDGVFLLGGFEPSEPIVGVLFDYDEAITSELVFTYAGEFDVTVDSRGYAIMSHPFNPGIAELGDFFALITARGSGVIATNDPLIAVNLNTEAGPRELTFEQFFSELQADYFPSEAQANNSSLTVAAASCTHTVRWGETLFRIARSYHLPMNDILTANPLVITPRLIYAGQSLTIPDCNRGSDDGAPVCTHTVQYGQTLYRIALNNRLTVAQMLAANPSITNSNLIYAGQVLNIPGCGNNSGD